MEHISTPILIVNFKTYKEATGKNALKLAKIAEKVRKLTGANIFVAPQFTDLANIAASCDVPVLAQHVDPISFGAYTGHILPEAIKQAGATGTLINHSEKPLSLKNIEIIVNRAQKLNLTSVICCDTPKTTASVAQIKPDIISIEPPELIGTGISVSKAKPEDVLETISLVRKIDASVLVLCGAGITRGQDSRAAIKLGANGILIASGIVKAKDQEEALLEIAKGLKMP